jgi:hypothetical protein
VPPFLSGASSIVHPAPWVKNPVSRNILFRDPTVLEVDAWLGFLVVPRPLRRLAWWYALNWSGYNRARTLGTFGMSVYSGLGAEGLHPLSPLTTTLNYGVIGTDGNVDVRIVYDHRVLDGSTVARALGDLEKVLTEHIPSSLVERGAAVSNATPVAASRSFATCADLVLPGSGA